MKNIVIIGAGYLAREVCGYITHCSLQGHEWRPKGFLDDRPSALSGHNYPSPILSSVEAYQPLDGDLFVCALGLPAHKQNDTSFNRTAVLKNVRPRSKVFGNPAIVIGQASE